MEKIALVDTIEALRSELSVARVKAKVEEIQFPVGSVQLEFQVGVTRGGEGGGKVNFWVLELGGTGSYDRQSVQRVIVNLGAPVDLDGRPIKVTRRSGHKP